MNIIKQCALLSLLCSMSIINSFAQIEGTNLIAYYPLNTGYVNSSNQLENMASNDYHLTPSVYPTFVASRNGAQNYGNGAVSLNGGTTQLNYDYSSDPAPFMQTANFAIGAWSTTTMPSFANEYQNIVTVGNNDIFIRYRKIGTSYSIQAGFRQGTNSFAVLTYNITSPSNFFVDTWGNPAWHHFALHRGGGLLELFVDGASVAVTFNNTAIMHSATNQSFKVGYGPDVNTHLNGKISDVFYYARPLDPLDFSRITCDKLSVSPISQEYAYCNVFSGTLISTSPAGATNVQWYTTPFDGTPIHTGNNFPIASMNTTTTYYVDASYSGGCTQKSYPRARIKVNINSAASQPTNTTPAANQTICAGTSTSLTASTVNSYIQWFDAPTGGNLLGTGNSLTTPVLNTTTTYYAESVSQGCGSSSRIAIQVNVNSATPPAQPTISTPILTTCANSSMTVIANAPGTTIRWYSAPTGGTLLHTGTNFTTPVYPNPSTYGVEDTYTYYVESYTACGGSSARVPVTITVKYQYTLTANPSANVTVCQGTTATLQVTTAAPQSTSQWIQGFSTVATNTFSFTTPPINSTTNYTAIIQPSNGCQAYVDFVITTTTAQQAAPTNSTPSANLVICNGSSTQLSATGASGIYWYNAPTNGTLLSSGSTYTTSALTGNTTFYAQQGSGACASTRTPIAVTVNQPSTGIASHTACGQYTWIDNVTYTSSNSTATHTIPNGAINGCDSIVTLNLTINNPVTGVATHNACAQFTWINNVTYTSSNNTATHTIVGGAVNGCDSIVTLNLTIHGQAIGTDIQTACESFTWIDGITYQSDNNTAVHIIPGGASTGCDSVVYLDLTINLPSTSTIFETSCDSYTWTNGTGQTYNQSGNHDFVISGGAMNGCDSTVTLVLTITDINTNTTINGGTITASQSNATYQWIDCDNGNAQISGATNQSFTPTTEGNYAVQITMNSCTETSACEFVDVVGLEDLSNFEIEVYPNPFVDEITIITEKTRLFEIYNTSGAIVQAFQSTIGTNTVKLQGLSSGVYFLKSEDGYIKKLIK